MKLTVVLLSALAALGMRPPSHTATRPVYVVLFTHIEDNSAEPSSPDRVGEFLSMRNRVIAMAERARTYNVKWALESDWTFLEADVLYDNQTIWSNTGSKNLFRYVTENLGMAANPHSHQNGGYNYTDVAYLLAGRLGVPATSVISGHIWNTPDWERYRTEQPGTFYQNERWRGDVLTGAASSSDHAGDPIISGVWHPKSRTQYFEDLPTGNMISIGSYKGTVAGVNELVDPSNQNTISASCMLTTAIHITPLELIEQGGIDRIATTILAPLAQLSAEGKVIITDFAGLAATWRSDFHNTACTSIAFTDALAPAGATPIKAAHVLELRTFVDSLRLRYGLASFDWTDAALAAGVTAPRAIHVAELRTALQAAYAAGGRAPLTFTNPAPTAGVTAISATHLTEIRAAVLAIW